MNEKSVNAARVRDHLANERTFLAWVRTSVALMGFGVVIARLRYLIVAAAPTAHGGPARSTLLGLAFVGVGLLSLVFAVVNFQRTRRAIETESFEPLGAQLTVFVGVLFGLGIAAAIYLFSLNTP